MNKLWETTMRKLAMMMLVAVMAFTFTGCSSSDDDTTAEDVVEDVVEEDVVEDDAEDAVEDDAEDAVEDDAEDVVEDDAEEEDSSLTLDDMVTAVGEGETTFIFTVTFADATMNLYEVSTDATTVGEALVEVGLIEGEDSDYGLYVTTVDGVTLDWDTDAAYWGFYIEGELAMEGVDSTDIVEGSTYTFAYAQ